MLDLLIFILVVLVITGILIENIRIKNNNRELLFSLTQLSLDNDAIKKKITSSEDVEKDHLIMFLSETREDSYQFIEKFQQELKNFKKELHPHVAYYNEFGILSEQYDIYSSMSKKFVEYYEKLLKFLPEEKNNGR